jgi:murein DD-endopeptidase MepM/ murein hydrolase activator NlpD
MRKNTIHEELLRIHELTYGKKYLTENNDDFINKILKILGIDNLDLSKIKTEKTDVLTNNIDDFYETLNDAVTIGGISQTDETTEDGKKRIEALQVGLQLLGYDLKENGVNGKLNDETKNAIKKFMEDNSIKLKEFFLRKSQNLLSEAVLMAPLENGMGTGGDFGVHRKGLDKAGKKHPGLDLHAKYEPVLSPADGVVIDSAIRDNACGGTLYIDHQNGFKSRFCHLKTIYVSKGDNVTQGEKVAISGGGKNDGISRGHSTGPHLHFELYKNNKLVNPRDYVGSELPKSDSIQKNDSENKSVLPVIVAADVLKKLIELLKQKNITSTDLSIFTGKKDKESAVTINNDDDFYKSILKCIGAPESKENMKFMYAWRQAEGGKYKNNTFNTKRDYQNATGSGVKNYETPEDGANATCETLKLSYYTCIVDGLKNDIGALEISQKCNSSLVTWGTHKTNPLITQVLKGYESGNPMKPDPIA